MLTFKIKGYEFMGMFKNFFGTKKAVTETYFKSLEADQIIHEEDKNLISLLIEKTEENKLDWEVPNNQDENEMIWTLASLDNVHIRFRRIVKVDREAKVKRVVFVLKLRYQMKTTIGDFSVVNDKTDKDTVRQVIRSYEGNRGSILSDLYEAIKNLDTNVLLKQVTKSSDILENL